MARKAWDDLSASYRQRLERGGITPAMHARGESIRKARGHQWTPEHPQQGIKSPGEFGKWFLSRQEMIDRINIRKEQLFGSLSDRAKRLTNEGVKGHVPTLANLKRTLDMSDAEILDRLHAQDLDSSFLFYH